jgi:CheY-like chemotaxis protein
VSQVLVVEDDRIEAMQYKIALEARKHKVSVAYDGEECLKTYNEAFSAARSAHSLKKHPYDIVIIDYRIPKIDGAQVAMEILSFNPRQRIVFATAYMSELIAHFQDITRLGRYVTLLSKPFDQSVLIDEVEDKTLHEQLRGFGINVDALLLAGATHDQLLTMLENIMKHSSNDDNL